MNENNVDVGIVANLETQKVSGNNANITYPERLSHTTGQPCPTVAERFCAWWRHQMETFSALLALCEGNSPVPSARPVTRSFDVFFDLRLNKRVSKPSRRRWFETPSRSLWRHCSGKIQQDHYFNKLRWGSHILGMSTLLLWMYDMWNRLLMHDSALIWCGQNSKDDLY